MSLVRYLKNQAFALVVTLMVMMFVALMLRVLNVDFAAVIFIELISALTLCTILVFDFMRRHRFYTQLAVMMEQLDEKQLIAELLDRPYFLEGALTYDALKAAGKSTNDRIAHHRRISDEYREYLESWVHEIKTPIASVGLIVENNRAELGSELASTLTGEFERIEAYVEQALYYARSAHVERDYAIRRVELANLVKTAIRRYSRTLIENGVTPQLGLLDFEVLADSKWLNFVLGQIIVNAAKYHKGNSEQSPTISFAAEHLDANTTQERVVLSIKDNGIGIPSGDVERVFDKGFTGENGRAYTHSTGIGLYLCKRLCTKMGLGIDLQSKEGSSTVVRITFPLSELHFVERS